MVNSPTRSIKRRKIFTIVQLIAVLMFVVGSCLIDGAPMGLADEVGGEVFLQGDYIEVGIDHDGYFGTDGNSPAGYHNIGRDELGFVADWGKDGWLIGSPAQSGDYFLPGSPAQGFSVEWGSDINFSNNGFGTYQIPTSSLVETSSGSRLSAVWSGNATSGSDQLKVTRTVTFSQDGMFFRIDVELENTGSTTLSSVEYTENVDPDQDRDLPGGGFETSNYISYQPGHSGNTDQALVVAKGTNYPVLTLGLGTIDSRAKVFYGSGLVHSDPDEILIADMPPNPGSPHVEDWGIAMAFDLGTLLVGDTFSFAYVYVLSEDDLDDAMAAMLAPTVDLNGTEAGFDYSTSYTEDSGWKTIVDGNATLTDPDSANIQSLLVTLTNHPDGSAEALTANTGSANISSSYNSSTGELTLSGSDTPANYQEVLRTVQYRNTSQNPSTATREIDFVANDGNADSNVAVSSVSVSGSNDAPNQPTNILPASGATGISLTPTLNSSAFSDPEAGDTHAASRWEVTTTQGDYSSPVYDSGTDAVNLTSITIPGGTLNCSTTYYWHVRHRDNNDAWSGNSTETSFVTGTCCGDVDTDTGTGEATLCASSGIMGSLTAVSESTLSCPVEGKPNLEFAHGFFSFNVTELTPGQTVTVNITLPQAVPVGTEYWKCQNNTWVDVTSLLGDDDGDNLLTLTITDGGLGDADGAANGVIEDPGAPGQPVRALTVGGEVYPVDKLSLLAPWIALAALMAVAMAALVIMKRRRVA